MNKITALYFLSVIFICVSCKSVKYNSDNNLQLPKKGFYGVYSAEFDTYYMGLDSYAVEFKEDKTARVIMFKIGNTKPHIVFGNWLLDKNDFIVLYFSNSLPSEYFGKNEDGTICILDKNKNKSSYILRKIYDN